ncbi:hypothetical protein [Acetobacter sp.]|uniref:hypothetical protein n=1 Tax=Acetobacter sp. TaxID=440 RepID=UPI0039E74FD5
MTLFGPKAPKIGMVWPYSFDWKCYFSMDFLNAISDGCWAALLAVSLPQPDSLFS